MPRRRRRRSPVMAKKRRRRFVVALIIIFIITGVGGFYFHQNPEIWEEVTTTASHLWDNALGFFANLFGDNLPAPGYAHVHFIDVGQGDAVLIRTSEGDMLIDGGDNHMGQTLVNYLQSQGVMRLDYVIATHPHADHIGGLIPVIRAFYINTLIMPNVAHTTRTFERFIQALEDNDINTRPPQIGENLHLGEAIFTVVAPNSAGHANLNDYSISLHMAFGDTSFLFTGDAERVSEEEMLAAGHNLSADVLHVGHHGSATSTTEDFLTAVSPAIAIISVGEDNAHGHPHATVLARLVAQGVRVYRTDTHGDVVVVTDGEALEVLAN